MSFIPSFIQKVVDYQPNETVTNEEYNEIFNLLITQGDSSSLALVDMNKDIDKLYVDFSDFSTFVQQQIVDITAGAVADGSVNYNKLDQNLKSKIDKIDTNASNLVTANNEISAYKTTTNAELIIDAIDIADLKLIADEAGKALSVSDKFYTKNNYTPKYSCHKEVQAHFTILQDTIANNVTQISANGFGLTKLEATGPDKILTIVGVDQLERPCVVEVAFSAYDHHKEILYFKQPFKYPTGVTNFKSSMSYTSTKFNDNITITAPYTTGNPIITVNSKTITLLNRIATSNYAINTCITEKRVFILARKASTDFVLAVLTKEFLLSDDCPTTLDLNDTTIFRPIVFTGFTPEAGFNVTTLRMWSNDTIITFMQGTSLIKQDISNLKNVTNLGTFINFGGTMYCADDYVFVMTRPSSNVVGVIVKNYSNTALTNTVTHTMNGYEANGTAVGSLGFYKGTNGRYLFLTHEASMYTSEPIYLLCFEYVSGTLTNSIKDQLGINNNSGRLDVTASSLIQDMSTGAHIVRLRVEYINYNDEYGGSVSYRWHNLGTGGTIQYLNDCGSPYNMPQDAYIGYKKVALHGYYSSLKYVPKNLYGLSVLASYTYHMNNYQSTKVKLFKDVTTSDTKVFDNATERSLNASGLYDITTGIIKLKQHIAFSSNNYLAYKNALVNSDMNEFSFNKVSSSNKTVSIPVVQGHVYVLGFDIMAKDTVTITSTGATGTTTHLVNPTVGYEKKRVNLRLTATASIIKVTFDIGATAYHVNHIINNVMLVDLTANYGVGSEPTIETINAQSVIGFSSLKPTEYCNFSNLYTKMLGGTNL